MTLKGCDHPSLCCLQIPTQAVHPECALAPHFRPEHPLVFRNAHKLFGVKNILRILEQINPRHKAEAMRSIIYEANMRDRFPVHGCLTAISDLQYQIAQAEDELHTVLTLLAVSKQYHEKQQTANLSSIVSRDSLQLGMVVVQPDNAPLANFRHNATLAPTIIHGHDEMLPVFDNIEKRQSYVDSEEEENGTSLNAILFQT